MQNDETNKPSGVKSFPCKASWRRFLDAEVAPFSPEDDARNYGPDIRGLSANGGSGS